jgi:hypothetical protein
MAMFSTRRFIKLKTEENKMNNNPKSRKVELYPSNQLQVLNLSTYPQIDLHKLLTNNNETDCFLIADSEKDTSAWYLIDSKMPPLLNDQVLISENGCLKLGEFNDDGEQTVVGTVTFTMIQHRRY